MEIGENKKEKVVSGDLLPSSFFFFFGCPFSPVALSLSPRFSFPPTFFPLDCNVRNSASRRF